MRTESDKKEASQDISRAVASSPQVCQSIDWYHECESRTVEVDGVEVTIRYVGRKGRKARIAITAPAGAVFS